MEEEIAGTETRKVRRDLIMKSIECFSKESGLILKMVGAAHWGTRSSRVTPTAVHPGRSLKWKHRDKGSD